MRLARLSGLIVLVAVTGFSMTACNFGGGKTITITDLPDRYIGKYGQVSLTIDNFADTIPDDDITPGSIVKMFSAFSDGAVGVFTEIPGDTLSIKLVTPLAKPFTRNGDYMVLFVIVSDLKNTTQVYYSGIILSKSITEKDTKISFNEFSGYSPNER
jgi:predicted small secreted protein